MSFLSQVTFDPETLAEQVPPKALRYLTLPSAQERRSRAERRSAFMARSD